MKTLLISALALALTAGAPADSTYDTCVKMAGAAGACVKPGPFITPPEPGPDPYSQMMERLQREADRQLWRQNIEEERSHRAGEVLYKNYLRYCAPGSKPCRDELYGN